MINFWLLRWGDVTQYFKLGMGNKGMWNDVLFPSPEYPANPDIEGMTKLLVKARNHAEKLPTNLRFGEVRVDFW
jgi:hypothetical protein